MGRGKQTVGKARREGKMSLIKITFHSQHCSKPAQLLIESQNIFI